MVLDELTVTELSARLVECDHAIATATHERLLIIAALDTKLTPPDTPAGCVKAAATAVAAASKCVPKTAAADVRLARDYVHQPDVQAAFIAGHLTAGQLGYVTTIAVEGNPGAAIDLARNGTLHALKQLADSTRRSNALRAERDRAARTNRRVRFAENDDQTEMTMITTGPWIEIAGVRQKLEQAATRMRKGFEHGEREWFDAAMYDALLANINGNIVIAKPRQQRIVGDPATETCAATAPTTRGNATAGPNGQTNSATNIRAGAVETFDRNTNTARSDRNENVLGIDCSDPDFNTNELRLDIDELERLLRFDHDDDEPFPEELDNETDDESSSEAILASLLAQHAPKQPGPISELGPPNKHRQPIIMKSDAKIVVTVDVTNGTATYLNGPAISHPRLDALLCFANIDLIGIIDGQPVGLATNQRTATPAQGRYMVHRDGPCRTPGCPGRGPTQFHHVSHYAHDPNAGTSTSICIALCMGCHHDHHDGRLTINGDPEGTITFTYTDGRTLKSTITHQQPPLTAA